MKSNKEKIFFYFIYLICFGVFVVTLHMYTIEKIFIKYKFNNVNAICIAIGIGIVLVGIYYSIVSIIVSWILNLVYIFSYKLQGYDFISFNFFPIIYIRNNKKSIKYSFNILLLNEIGSMIDIKDTLSSEKELEEYFRKSKKVYSNLVYVHYILILIGMILSLYNFSLGGIVVTYNIAIILFQSIGNSEFWGYGYVYLSKSFEKKNSIYGLINLLKVQNIKKNFIYDLFQKEIIDNNEKTTIIDEFYQTIMIDSISNDFNYLNIQIKKRIETNLKQYANFNLYEFIKHYRLYRLFCIYVLKFYGYNEYELLVKEMNKFYSKTKYMRIVRRMDIFKKEMKILNEAKFKSLNLKNKFDICNKFDTYIEKLNMITNTDYK